MSCGQGLRYRVVLCLDHRGQHAGGCDPAAKPQVKEACLGAVPCYKPPSGSLLRLCFCPHQSCLASL